MTIGELAGATIVFDLDGTLVDSAPDLVRALNETMDIEGLPHIKVDGLRRMVGQGARVLIERAAALHGVSFSPQRLDELTDALTHFYSANIALETRPFPGVLEAMETLAALGAKFAVCTNKRTWLSLKLLETLNIRDRFSAVIGADSVAERKPHPDHYRAAVAAAGGVVRRSVMIGDSIADVGSARGAGAPVIVYRFGYSDVGADQLGADVILDRYSDLAPACRRLLAARP